MIYIIIIAYFGQLPILCGPPHAAAAMFLLHFIFRYFKCGMKVSFLSNIIPRNLYSSTTGISTLSSFRLGSLKEIDNVIKLNINIKSKQMKKPKGFVYKICRHTYLSISKIDIYIFIEVLATGAKFLYCGQLNFHLLAISAVLWLSPHL